MSVGRALIRFGFALIIAAAVIGVFALFVISAENVARERQCFDAGGRVENGVCVPVHGAITFKTESA